MIARLALLQGAMSRIRGVSRIILGPETASSSQKLAKMSQWWSMQAGQLLSSLLGQLFLSLSVGGRGVKSKAAAVAYLGRYIW